jgi:phosphoserine phosphatase
VSAAQPRLAGGLHRVWEHPIRDSSSKACGARAKTSSALASTPSTPATSGKLYRPGARSVLDEHRARGERVVILTSASCYLADAVARELAFEDVLANRFEVDAHGIYTGKPLNRMLGPREARGR